MEETTPKTDTPEAKPGLWGRLHPDVRRVIMFLAALAVVWAWPHLFPGQPAPQLQPPQPPAVLVLNVSPTPAAPAAPISVAGK